MPDRTIQVVSSIGSGRTPISAFDQALTAAGVHNTNLIRLSSVVPAGWAVTPVAPDAVSFPFTWGDRLYVVQSDARSDQAGEVIGAGIGWVFLDADHGLMVEHHMHSMDRKPAAVDKAVIQDIRYSLEDLVRNRGGDPGAKGLVYGHLTAVATVTGGQSACALVTAIYGAEPWEFEGLDQQPNTGMTQKLSA